MTMDSTMSKERHLVVERRHLVVDPRDNVTTLLDDRIDATRLADTPDGGLRIEPGIAFGHKAALRAIAAGEPVLKYGIAIGVATRDIAAGAHVHVHNCR